jgi:hypothetical protein
VAKTTSIPRHVLPLSKARLNSAYLLSTTVVLALKMADASDLLARDEGETRGHAAQMLLQRARDHPPHDGKWRFWLEDGKWKQAEMAGISIEGWET